MITANRSMLEFAGVELEDIRGMEYYDLPWWNHSEDLQNRLVFAIGEAYNTGEPIRFSATYSDKREFHHEIDFIIKPIVDGGEVQMFLAMGYNITDLVRTKRALTQREKEIKAFFDYSSDGYFFFTLPMKAHFLFFFS